MKLFLIIETELINLLYIAIVSSQRPKHFLYIEVVVIIFNCSCVCSFLSQSVHWAPRTLEFRVWNTDSIRRLYYADTSLARIVHMDSQKKIWSGYNQKASHSKCVYRTRKKQYTSNKQQKIISVQMNRLQFRPMLFDFGHSVRLRLLYECVVNFSRIYSNIFTTE